MRWIALCGAALLIGCASTASPRALEQSRIVYHTVSEDETGSKFRFTINFACDASMLPEGVYQVETSTSSELIVGQRERTNRPTSQSRLISPETMGELVQYVEDNLRSFEGELTAGDPDLEIPRSVEVELPGERYSIRKDRLPLAGQVLFTKFEHVLLALHQRALHGRP